MSNKLIYSVEDDKHISELIKYNLTSQGYEVICFNNGEDLLKACKNSSPDMFLLDLMLPGMSGLQICQHLNSTPGLQNIPKIILTAKSEEFDKVLGFELGADDYITKPFSVKELQARVKALFRRSTQPNNDSTYAPSEKSQILSFPPFELNVEKHQVLKNGIEINLTLKEFELFKLLIQNKGKVLTRELLLDKVWGYDYYGESRTVDVHVRYLRQKIEDDDSTPHYIETIRGVGYRLKESQ